MATLNTSHQSVSLTAPQLHALGTAAERDDGALVLPARLKGRAAQSFVGALTGKGLVREVRAKRDMPVCRRDAEAGRSYALVITRLGRSSIPAAKNETTSTEAEPQTRAAEKPSLPEEKPLVADRAGPEMRTTERNGAQADTPAKKAEPHAGAAAPASSNAPRSGSKLAEVIRLLVCENGASIEELTASTGWLSHTTRAALTGLRKRGYGVVREHFDGKGSVYRIEPVSSAKAA